MDAPPVQYVTTSDGMSIAYAVAGHGTPLLVLPGVFYHVQYAWEFPGLGQWLEALASHYQVILMDIRGTGMSTRDVGDDHVLSHYQRDLEAVIDKLNLRRFLLLAVSRGVDLVVDYALKNPDWVIGLVLGTSGQARSSSIFQILPQEDWDLFLHSIVPHDTSPEEANRMVELTKQASDQRNYMLRWRALGSEGDLAPRLRSLQTPTLVLHSRGYVITPPEEGMKKAQLTGGRMVLIDGSDPWGDGEQTVRAIQGFTNELMTLGAVDDAHLSIREQEVLRLIAAGQSNQEIADTLVISLNTVRRHVSNIYDKIGVSSRTQAMLYASGKGHGPRRPVSHTLTLLSILAPAVAGNSWSSMMVSWCDGR